MGILAVLAVVIYLMTRDAKRYRARITKRISQPLSEKDWKSPRG